MLLQFDDGPAGWTRGVARHGARFRSVAPAAEHAYLRESVMPTSDLAEIIAHAARRTLAAVVTHLSGDPNAVPDLRDRAQIDARAAEVLPAYVNGELTVEPPS